jgi:hypothetical protein
MFNASEQMKVCDQLLTLAIFTQEETAIFVLTEEDVADDGPIAFLTMESISAALTRTKPRGIRPQPVILFHCGIPTALTL